mgnify:CR=1 FL=1
MITGADSAHLSGRANPIFLEGKQPVISETTARALSLRDGQIVQGLVQAQGGQLSLLLKGRQIEVSPDLKWIPGETITAQVRLSSTGVWTLQPISAEQRSLQNSLLSSPTSLEQSFSRLSALLFKSPGQEALATLFRPGFLDSLVNSLNISQLQARWHALRLSMPKLTAKDIKQAVINASGRESGLIQGTKLTTADSKQFISQLLSLIRFSNLNEGDLKSMDSILRQGIDDLEASQIHAVQSQIQNGLMFSLVLPFKDAHPVELTFRKQSHTPPDPPVFTVNVHSKSDDFGELWLQTELKDQNNVDLVMWARREDIVEKARAKASLLGNELGKEGLLMHSFKVIHGPRESQGPEWVASGRGLILDIQA